MLFINRIRTAKQPFFYLFKSSLIPCSISSTKSRNDYKPIILQGSEGERILNKIKGISEDLNK
ncbi:hypothetical protein [Romboutsia ilealis]|uniref:hypothetical protein n=1 Tax=Romboutsia ilealis TaxID=1115758 RepID=UPI00272BC2C9|nr:hypothetical protein [Romboutsia ilealis]